MPPAYFLLLYIWHHSLCIEKYSITEYIHRPREAYILLLKKRIWMTGTSWHILYVSPGWSRYQQLWCLISCEELMTLSHAWSIYILFLFSNPYSSSQGTSKYVPLQSSSSLLPFLHFKFTLISNITCGTSTFLCVPRWGTSPVYRAIGFPF